MILFSSGMDWIGIFLHKTFLLSLYSDIHIFMDLLMSIDQFLGTVVQVVPKIWEIFYANLNLSILVNVSAIIQIQGFNDRIRPMTYIIGENNSIFLYQPS